MAKINHYQTTKQKRAKRVRKKLHGTAKRPRLSVYRSNQHTFLQAINDDAGKTVASAHVLQAEVTKKAKKDSTKTDKAVIAAGLVADQLKKQKVSTVVFDRGAYRYHGRVKAVAEALREAGITV